MIHVFTILSVSNKLISGHTVSTQSLKYWINEENCFYKN